MNRRFIFGIYALTPYNLTTGEFYGQAKVLGELAMEFSGELIGLTGGSNKYEWAVEEGLIKADVSLKLKEYPPFMFELAAGKAPTVSGSSATGTVGSLTNKMGSSVMHATTGIASVAAIPTTGAANLKFGRYVVKAVDATTFDVYVSTDINFRRGTDASYSDESLLKITASPLTVTASTDTDIAAFGLRFAGGSGTIGMTAGDTAVFDVDPPSSESMEVTIGGKNDSFPEFGLLAWGKKSGTEQISQIEIFRCKAAGLPISMAENAYSNAELKMKAIYDETQDGVASFKQLTAA